MQYYYSTVKLMILLFLLPIKGSVRSENSIVYLPFCNGAVNLKV